MKRRLLWIGIICLIAFCSIANFAEAQNERPIVKLVYFHPKDVNPHQNVDADMHNLIVNVQQFFANEMERHGYGRKTFLYQTDEDRKAMVYHITGTYSTAYYRDDSFNKIRIEVVDKLKKITSVTTDHIILTAASGDLSHDSPLCQGFAGWADLGNGNGGFALVCVGNSINIQNYTIETAHELGHIFGLGHDFRFRSSDYIMSYGPGQTQLSPCSAEWLHVHRAFNPKRTFSNKPSTIKMLSSTLETPPNSINFRFEIIDPEGVHQVQLLTSIDLLGCNSLDEDNSLVEFVTDELTIKNNSVTIHTIDRHGSITWSNQFPIDITTLLPPAEIVSIPDNNLAATIREEIGNNITTHTILNLRKIIAHNHQITDLTGLEHAHNLRQLGLGAVYITGEGVVNSNKISDLSPIQFLAKLVYLDVSYTSLHDLSDIAMLTQLNNLNVSNTLVSNVTPLSELTQLTTLNLKHNNIVDISALTGLNNLEFLDLSFNNITEISSLRDLTNLSSLYLESNNITDISPLKNLTQSELTQLTTLNLKHNNIVDISALTGLNNLEFLDLSFNNITEISPLHDLTKLNSLYLWSNNIKDISPLKNLIQLEILYMGANDISNVTPLSDLLQLKYLGLIGNNISDISSLVGLSLTGTTWSNIGLQLQDNPLSNESIRTHIPAMQAKGIVVTFDNITHPEFHLISGDEQTGVVGKQLLSPFVVEYVDANGKPKRGVSVTFSIRDGEGELTDKTVTTDADGRAETYLKFSMKLGSVTVRATAEGVTTPITFTAKAVLPDNHVPEDVNVDGVVDVMDLVLVAATIGTTPPENTLPNPDVNGDGVINSEDLALVMAALENTSTAPAAAMTAENLQRWIDEAKQLANKDEAFLRGIEVLEQLLETLLPKKTALLANYPNPFNPETWIPYHLAKPAEVTLHIYGVDGALVRTLKLGHRHAGIYEHQTRAAYWDGRNAQGERVASGIYLYTLTAGDYTSTRKMLIRK